MADLSPASKQLIANFEAWKKSQESRGDHSKIHVDEVASRVAAFYEKIHTIVDWKEDHLMRRGAIGRKLKKRLEDVANPNFSGAHVAESLVLDLIRGGYFPNDKIEESKIGHVQQIVEKYIFILRDNAEKIGSEDSDSRAFYNAIFELAACEIEQNIDPSFREMALIEYMFEQMKERIKVNENVYQRTSLKRGEQDVQIYIAVQQALFKFDTPIISYNITRYIFPQWDNPTKDQLAKLSKDLYALLATIRQDISNPVARKFYNICEKYDTAYLLLGDILFTDSFDKSAGQLQDPATLEGYIKTAYTRRLNSLREKITRAAIYSTISIFVTKFLSLLILEYVIAVITRSNLDYLRLIVDILVPTILMIIMVITVKPPSKKNINLVVVEVMKTFYYKEKSDTYEVRVPRKRGLFTRLFLSFTYLASACVSFGFIFWIFHYFKFPIYSIVINIIFIALILFAGTAIQRKARELTIEDESTGFMGFFADILFLPITGVGRWMSETWKDYNAITAFLNLLIDMPFSMFVEFIERWRGFVKEQKEEMR
jgi:hypothetical protein